ncbi:MAG: hypothetical protein EOM80_12100 [Erysipelotrichia bacterium]|nr:hypothetical protein [Erysipelotrichia bacterium]
MSQYKSQIQNQFLSQARKRHLKVEVILETGTVLRGKLKAYDQFSISLSFKDKVEIVYKSSIIYISILPQLRPPMGERRPYSRTSPEAPRSGGYRRPYNDEQRPLPVPPARRPFPDFDEDHLNDPPPPKKAPVKRY